MEYPRKKTDLDVYTNCVLTARHSIISLEIHGSDDNSAKDRYKRLSNKLNLFPLLQEIEINDTTAKFISNIEYYTTHCQSTTKSIIYNTRFSTVTVMPAVNRPFIQPQPQIA